MMRRFATRVLLALLLPCLPFAAASISMSVVFQAEVCQSLNRRLGSDRIPEICPS